MQRSPSPMTYVDPSTDPNIGMYDLARDIDAIRERSQIRFPSNPMSPTFGVVDPDAESARRLAPMLAQDAARQQNTPMNGMTAYEANPMRYRPGDPAIQARQQDNAQRMTTGRPMDRTRDGGALNAYIASGGTPWYEREKQARDQMAMQSRQSTPEFQAAMAAMQQQKTAREALRDRSNLNVPQAELDRRNDADIARREREARHNQFKEANNGMNYRQYDRLQNQNALTLKAVDEGRLSPAAANFRMQTRADKALRRAGNPMMMGTDASRRLFPDMAAGRGGRAATPNQNPMGGGRTLEAQQSAATRIQERETNSPLIAGLGVEPGSGLAGLNVAIQNRIAEDPNTEFSDDALKEYQAHAKDYSGISTDQNSFFAFGNSEVDKQQAEMWRELAKLPDNPRSRLEWLQQYKLRTAGAKARMAESMKEDPLPPVVEGGTAPIAGNPFGYAAPYSNTFNRGIKPLSMYNNPMK